MPAVDLAVEEPQLNRQNQLRIIVMEDSTTEAQGLMDPLRTAGYAIAASRVRSVLEFQVCLKKQEWDLILSSAQLSEFSPQQALALLKHARRDIPMIVIAPEHTTPEQAVELMRAGARDVVLRNQPERIVNIAQRELSDLAQRRARQHFETLYRDTERRTLSLLEHAPFGAAYLQDSSVVHTNRAWNATLGGESGKTGTLRALLDLIPADAREQLNASMQRIQSGADTTGNITTRVKYTQGGDRECTLEINAACYEGNPCIQLLLLDTAATKPVSPAVVTPLTPARPTAAKEVNAENAERDASIRRHIESALATSRFRLVYQPIVNLHAEAAENYEVLVRMLDDNNIEMMPGEFMSVAEETGLMSAIDRCIITLSFKALAERRKNGKETCFFIKLSEDSLQDPGLVSWINSQLKAAGVPGNSVVFEIKESSAIALLENTKALIAALKSIRCRIALDHFGNHPQSLDHLDHLPVEFIKLAGSFMDKLAKDPRTEAAIKVIVQAARGKGTQSVATFVQEATNLTTLWQCGLDYIQGYFLQRPDALLSYDFSS